MPITLVLADDHPIVLNGLQQLFNLEPDCQVLSCCLDGAQTVQVVRRQRPDVLILDLRLPGKDGLTILRELSAERLPTRVVVLTAALDEDELLEAMRLGVRGVILKEMAPHFLLQCVRKVHAGGEWLERDAVGRALDKMLQRRSEAQPLAAVLTPREIELVRMVARGLRNKEIARKLAITEGTVKIHLHNIYEKLQVRGRMDVIIYAQSKGLL
ncbi:MAG TPA: response regulator transcription factor [Candidatus Competibacteraceae bacterium]|nr:response regulator transcription factor [Candidatus Competibacteraceae bacterium]